MLTLRTFQKCMQTSSEALKGSSIVRWTKRLVGPSRSPCMSYSSIILYPVWRHRTGRQYWAIVSSFAAGISSRTRNMTRASCGQVTVNCIVSFHDGLNPLFWITRVLEALRSAATPWTSTWHAAVTNITNAAMFLVACDTRFTREVDRKKIEAFEMWIWRRMEKISWKDKITNVDVLKRVNEERSLLKEIWQRKQMDTSRAKTWQFSTRDFWR